METVKAAKFLVCVDQRPESKVALRLACMKAAARGGAVDILHVVPPADFQTLGSVAERMREERRGEAEQVLKTLADEAAAAHGITPSLMLREGAAGEGILAAALEDADVNMLVIGIAQQSSGRGTLAAWLAGQLGVKLFIPLLMVPGNLTDQQLLSLV
jgi:nucleotide-binding universal stress UspA family protein